MVFAVFFHGTLPETDMLYGYNYGYIVLESLRLEDVFPFKMASLKVAVDLPRCLGSLLLKSSQDALYSGLKYISLGQ